MKKNNQAFHHKHSLGQNFIDDEGLVRSLVEFSNVGKEDNVLEIGPGMGSMTEELCKTAKYVISLEIDQTLLPFLNVRLQKYDNFKLVHGDVMRVSLPQITEQFDSFHVVANIPYYITTPLITLLLNSPLNIESMNLMLQKEAAEKMLSAPSTDGYGPLPIFFNLEYELHIATIIGRDMFTPPPNVDSAFLVARKRKTPLTHIEDMKVFKKVVHAAFLMRRKTLLNNLMNVFSMSREDVKAWLQRADLKENIRGEVLSIEQFATLSNCI